MEFTLIAVTMLSLFLAISMGVVAWRLVQEERRRSEARLAALAAELRRDERRSANGDPDLLGPETPTDPAPTDGSAALGGLFSPPVASASSGWTGVAALGGAAAVVLVVVATVFLLSASDDGDARMTENIRPPLDLIALQHAEEGPFLDISGSVRNPADAVAVDRLSIVAMAYDQAGTLIATRRTPVENPALAAGADSAFIVRLPAAGVSRYRISFLLDDTTISHIDRRPVVQTPRPTGDPS